MSRTVGDAERSPEMIPGETGAIAPRIGRATEVVTVLENLALGTSGGAAVPGLALEQRGWWRRCRVGKGTAKPGRSGGRRARTNALQPSPEGLPDRRLLASLGPQPYAFTTFQVPGSNDTVVSGINEAGTVTGTSGVGGYVRDADGNFTVFSAPDLPSTIATGINNSGTVVAYNTFGYGPGLLRDATGDFTAFRIPGLSTERFVGIFNPRINDVGDVAGGYSTGDETRAFLRDAAGNIVTFGAPGASYTTVEAINDAGTILGTSDSPLYPYYLRDAAGNFTTFTVPGGSGTRLDAINDAGTVAGTYMIGGQRRGYLRDAAGNFTSFDVPQANNYAIATINNSGMVAWTTEVGGVDQGFLRDVDGDVMVFDVVPGGDIISLKLNDAGVLAGSVRSPAGRTGFIAAPGEAVATPPVEPPDVPPGTPPAGLPAEPPAPPPVTPLATPPDDSPVGIRAASRIESPVAPPVVTSVRRMGFRLAPTRIVVGFSAGLDPSRAQDVRNYSIVDSGGRSIAIDSATYSAATNSVTLRPRRRLDLRFIYRVTINGSVAGGLASGDGEGDGQQGSDHVMNLTASNLVLNRSVPGGPSRLARLKRTLVEIQANQARELARLQPAAEPVAMRAKATGPR